jgi:hypothetical protein
MSNSMKYFITLQDNGVTASCFDGYVCFEDGYICFGEINTAGTVERLLSGDVINGKFHQNKEREITIRER